MPDYSFPLNQPLNARVSENRMYELNSLLHAVRFFRSSLNNQKIRILVKDNIGVRDFPTSAGSYALKNLHLRDAFCISQLRKNPEFDIFGKTHMTELAGFVSSKVLRGGYSELGGFGRNPHGDRLDCFGSSSGSAIAVAAGFCNAALGTETRGSLMLPAMANGDFGFKPTRGSISREGIIPLSSSFDAPGVIARNLQQIEKIFSQMIGFDSRDNQSFPAESLSKKVFSRKSILVVLTGTEDLQRLKTIYGKFFETLRAKGFRVGVVKVQSPEFDYKVISSQGIRRDMTEFLKTYHSAGIPESFAELVECYRCRKASHPYGMDRLEDALAMDYMNDDDLKSLADKNINKANAFIDRLLETYDADAIVSLSYTDWWAIGGGPTVAIPIGAEQGGKPISLMVGARRREDYSVLNLAKQMLK